MDYPRPISSLGQMEDDRTEIVRILESYKLLCTQAQRLIGPYGVTLNELFGKVDYWSSSPDIRSESLMRRVDSAMWDVAVCQSGIDNLITSGDAAALRDKIATDPPIFTEKAAQEMILSVAKSGSTLLSDTVRKIFTNVAEQKYRPGNTWRSQVKTPNAFMIKSVFRISLFYGGFPEFWRSGTQSDFINDLELACVLVNGAEKPAYPNRLADKMMASHFSERTPQAYGENDYFSVKIHKNGNAVFKIKCAETLSRINTEGADHRSIGGA